MEKNTSSLRKWELHNRVPSYFHPSFKCISQLHTWQRSHGLYHHDAGHQTPPYFYHFWRRAREALSFSDAICHEPPTAQATFCLVSNQKDRKGLGRLRGMEHCWRVTGDWVRRQTVLLEAPMEYCRNGVTADKRRSKISQRGFLEGIRHTHRFGYIILQLSLLYSLYLMGIKSSHWTAKFSATSQDLGFHLKIFQNLDTHTTR